MIYDPFHSYRNDPQALEQEMERLGKADAAIRKGDKKFFTSCFLYAIVLPIVVGAIIGLIAGFSRVN